MFNIVPTILDDAKMKLNRNSVWGKYIYIYTYCDMNAKSAVTEHFKYWMTVPKIEIFQMKIKGPYSEWQKH